MASVTIVVVLLILWLALKQARIIVAVLVNLAVGLSFTAAIGLAMVGALNLISVAFAVLFIGLGVDFGIQFSVRYRAERFADRDLLEALESDRRAAWRARFCSRRPRSRRPSTRSCRPPMSACPSSD